MHTRRMPKVFRNVGIYLPHHTSACPTRMRKKLVKFYVWSIALFGAGTWTLRAVDYKHLESFEIWCWRRMVKISWTDRVGNEVLLRVKEQRNILHEISKRKANLMVIFRVETAFYSGLLKVRENGG